ncbi:MAG: acyltransferase [Planctomycetes bacterium]|nr:acyltransferase [Planctomycetota bacterium]
MRSAIANMQDQPGAGPGEVSLAAGGKQLDARFSGYDRLDVLDGWRAISILLVMATHMLPLGPKWMDLNSTAGPAGMSLFFTLSGFLITVTLHKHGGVLPFLVRRLFRIVPLAVVGSSLILILQAAPFRAYPPLWFYYWNYFPTSEDVKHVSHFWSLCVEMHFYLFVGLLVGACGRRGFLLLPLLAVAVTAWRAVDGVYIGIATHRRVDEILAGATLALCLLGALGRPGEVMLTVLRRIPFMAILIAFGVSCHPASGPVQYFRPYLGTAVIGSTLVAPGLHSQWLRLKVLRYVADVSYALYVVHPASMMGWMGSGDTVVRYLKRPLCFALTFALAHVSTFYFERPLTELGKRISKAMIRPSDTEGRVVGNTAGAVSAGPGPSGG